MALPHNISSIQPKAQRMESRNVLTFDPELAAKIGIEGAIFLAQLDYWIKKSGKTRDGKVWVYNTLNDWLEQFPFWKKSALHRIITDLESQGLITTTSEYNLSKIDRTKWYTINQDHEYLTDENPDESTISHFPEMHHRFPGNASSISRKSDAPIPETTTETTTVKTKPPVSPKPKRDPIANPSGPEQTLIATWCGIVEAPAPANYRKALGNAKSLVNAGITAENMPSLIAWMQADAWYGPKGHDLGLMVSAVDKWRTASRVRKAAPLLPVESEPFPEDGGMAEYRAYQQRENR